MEKEETWIQDRCFGRSRYNREKIECFYVDGYIISRGEDNIDEEFILERTQLIYFCSKLKLSYVVVALLFIYFEKMKTFRNPVILDI